MKKIRKAAVSGLFYPDKKGLLDKMLDSFLESSFEVDSTPKAIIVPHAGYIYSGSTVASAFKALHKLKNKITKVVLIGPSHKTLFKGLAIPNSSFFETPLGKIKVDQETIQSLKNLPQVIISEEAHAKEPSLEVILPCLHKVVGEELGIIPIVVGESNAEDVREVIIKLWGGDETLIIISTDLIHYHSYRDAFQIDRQTCVDIENLNSDELSSQKLCGFLPVLGLIEVAKKKELDIKLVDFCNSGDVIVNDQPINANRVVGYASFYCGTKNNIGNFISKAHKKELIRVALSTISHCLANNHEPPEYLDSLLSFSNDKVATFVTLKINNVLRGCIGTLAAKRDILQDVAYNAYQAAFCDPRFHKLTTDELENVELSISILTKPKPLLFKSEKDLLKKIEPGIDGLILTQGKKKGTFLPSAWEDITNVKDFLEQLKLKSGLKKGYWSDDIKIQKYTAVNFSELDF
jgi:AmmeMemoRadiSam system protein B/AmmeMemoRadiSam system protein A